MKKLHGWMSASVAVAMLVLAQGAWAAGSGTANKKGDAASGAKIYNETCVACHGSDGKGIMSGMPNFNNANGVLSLSNEVLSNRIDHGFSDGKAPMAMPPKGGNPSLTKSDIQNVIAYLKSHFKG